MCSLNKEFVKIKVLCPRDPGAVYDMEITFLTTADGLTINAPCNGCDFLHECEDCTQCLVRITSFFFRRPKFRSQEPIDFLNVLNDEPEIP